MKRMPFLGSVLIRRCCSPVSPIALRAAFMRLNSAELRNDAALPDRGNQLILADHALAMLDQVNQQIENLRLDSNSRATATQLTATGMQLTVAEAIPQGSHSFG